MGLSNHPDPANLMANGTSGADLDDDQVNLARSVAPTLRGAATTAEVRKAALAAQASGERVEARRLWSWLAELPGPDADGAKRRRDYLDRLNLP